MNKYVTIIQMDIVIVEESQFDSNYCCKSIAGSEECLCAN